MTKVSNSNPTRNKLCMGYMYGFFYPDCKHCECLGTCFPETMEDDVSTRGQKEQNLSLSKSKKGPSGTIITLPKPVKALYRLFS